MTTTLSPLKTKLRTTIRKICDRKFMDSVSVIEKRPGSFVFAPSGLNGTKDRAGLSLPFIDDVLVSWREQERCGDRGSQYEQNEAERDGNWHLIPLDDQHLDANERQNRRQPILQVYELVHDA